VAAVPDAAAWLPTERIALARALAPQCGPSANLPQGLLAHMADLVRLLDQLFASSSPIGDGRADALGRALEAAVGRAVEGGLMGGGAQPSGVGEAVQQVLRELFDHRQTLIRA
jgi:hypothetical protein